MNTTKQVFVYTKKGKFVEEFVSQKTFREKYLLNEIAKTPLFINTVTSKKFVVDRYTTLQYSVIDDFYVFKERVYREDVTFIDKLHNSKLCCKHYLRNEPVQLFNLNGDLIGEVLNRSVLAFLISGFAEQRSTMTIELSSKRISEEERVYKPKRFCGNKEIFIKNKL